MANKRAFIVPARNDIHGMSLQLRDLTPNSSTGSMVNDTPGQSGYVPQGMDQPGTTVRDVTNGAYFSGSTNTLTPSTLALADIDGNLADDSKVTPMVDFGLAAYLRDTLEGGAANAVVSVANSKLMAQAILNLVIAGTAPTLANINTALAVVVAGTGLSGTGDSFGTVTDILRILSGEVYMVPKSTVICTNADVWQTVAERVALIGGVAGYSSRGRFLTIDDPGYRAVKTYMRTTAFNLSVHEGDLAALKTTMSWQNPAYAYADGDVLGWKPRAKVLSGTSITGTTAKRVVYVYDYLGNAL